MNRATEATAKGVRRALAIGLAGVAIQLVAGLRWTPGTFVLSAAIGLPLVFIGGTLFVRAAWRADGDKTEEDR